MKRYLLFHDDLVYKGYHLWYLNALLYAWTIVYFIKYFFKEKGTKLLYSLIPILLACSVIFSNYSSILFGKYNLLLSRNYLFCGIPYITLGGWMSQKKKKLCQSSSIRGLLLLLIILSAAVCLEEVLLSPSRVSIVGDYYICTVFQAITIFLLFLKIHNDHPKARWIKPLAKIGRDHSLQIYVLHPIFHISIWKILVRLKINRIYDSINVEPILVFFATLIASKLLLQLRQSILHLKHLKST